MSILKFLFNVFSFTIVLPMGYVIIMAGLGLLEKYWWVPITQSSICAVGVLLIAWRRPHLWDDEK